MSDRRRHLKEEEAEAKAEETEFTEATAEMGAEEEATVVAESTKLDVGGQGSIPEDPLQKKQQYMNHPPLGAPEPNFDDMTKEFQRQWLRDHGVKGTWSKKLSDRCREAWDDMQAETRQRVMNGEISEEEALQGGPAAPAAGDMDTSGGESEMPNFLLWTMERKRLFLRRRDVKGIWGKHVDEKCAEIWKAERAGEKYVHTPPSLGKTIKSRFPGQSVMMAMSSTTTSSAATTAASPSSMHGGIMGAETYAPVQMSQSEFQNLAEKARGNDLRGVSDMLNSWGRAQNLAGDDSGSANASSSAAPGESVQVLTAHSSSSIITGSPSGAPETTSSASHIEYRWVHSEVTEKGVRPVRVKRVTSISGTPTSKRRKVLEGSSPAQVIPQAPEIEDIIEMEQNLAENPVSILQRDLESSNAQNQTLQARLLEVEAQNQLLRQRLGETSGDEK
jgi:hypothetical protein